MVANIDLSQEMLAFDLLTASEQSRKHFLKSLRLYGDQALDILIYNNVIGFI